MNIQMELLTGSTKKRARNVMLEKLASGEINILIGTHALIEKAVQFKELGLVVIDEQHRFGVEQRAKLWSKNEIAPHVLVMTATPIPRTLAMTIYGDLDTSVIDELPPGRKPIKTIHKYDNFRFEVYEFLKKQISRGRQIYIVYPLIEESETLDYENLMRGYDIISEQFPRPEYQVSIVHGRMKAKDKEIDMAQFIEGRTHIMVATTVIEVGVNVPNASVMLIESAERFGLSQLHQLRGRVGRGSDQSYCILLTSPKLTAEAKERMHTMVSTNDGFKIAEVDLRLRGPGDLMGTRQSGILDLRLADLSQDGDIVRAARKAAEELIAEDPQLVITCNRPIAIEYENLYREGKKWSHIS